MLKPTPSATPQAEPELQRRAITERGFSTLVEGQGTTPPTRPASRGAGALAGEASEAGEAGEAGEAEDDDDAIVGVGPEARIEPDRAEGRPAKPR